MKTCLSILMTVALLLGMTACPALGEEAVFYYTDGMSLHLDPDCQAAHSSSPMSRLTEAEARHPRYKDLGLCRLCAGPDAKRPETDDWGLAFASVAEKAEKCGGIYALPEEGILQPEEAFSRVRVILMREFSLLRSAVADDSLYMIYYYPQTGREGRPCYDISLFQEDSFKDGYGLSLLASVRLDAETMEILGRSVSGKYRLLYGDPPWEKAEAQPIDCIYYSDLAEDFANIDWYYAHVRRDCPCVPEEDQPRLKTMSAAEARLPFYWQLTLCPVCMKGMRWDNQDDLPFMLLSLEEKAERLPEAYSLPPADAYPVSDAIDRVRKELHEEYDDVAQNPTDYVGADIRKDTACVRYFAYYFPESERFGRPYYAVTVAAIVDDWRGKTKIMACATRFFDAETGDALAKEEEEEEQDCYSDESELRTLVYTMDDTGLTSLKILMHDGSESVFERDRFPQHLALETYHDGNAILMDYYGGMPEGPFDREKYTLENHWFMTFQYDGEIWRLTDFTNGVTWMASVDDGYYTFDDYYDSSPEWKWSAFYDDRLETLDFSKLEFLVELYDLQMPNHPSLNW